MKVLMIECTAEELRANRTVLDSLTEVFSSITRAFAGVDLTNEDTAKIIGGVRQEDEEDASEED